MRSDIVDWNFFIVRKLKRLFAWNEATVPIGE
jgi:hypothetical protein